MRRIATLALAASGALTAACTPMQWVKQDATPEQLNKDVVECQNAAWREASFRPSYSRAFGPVVARDSLGRPFLVWPQSAFVDPFGEQFLEESRLAHFCMHSKGYELVPAEKKK